MDAVSVGTGIGCKKARQPLRRDVGGEYLHLVALLHHLLMLGDQDGKGIGLIAGGATRAPDTDCGACGLAGKELGDGPVP